MKVQQSEAMMTKMPLGDTLPKRDLAPASTAPASGYQPPRLVRHGALVDLVQQLPSPPDPPGKRRPAPKGIFSL